MGGPLKASLRGRDRDERAAGEHARTEKSAPSFPPSDVTLQPSDVDRRSAAEGAATERRSTHRVSARPLAELPRRPWRADAPLAEGSVVLLSVSWHADQVEIPEPVL